MQEDSKNHWEKIYTTKQPNEVSWTQAVPQTSLNYIDGFKLGKDAAIIDVGGGDSNLVDFLIERGYTDITVLDISSASIDRAKARLGSNADSVHWIVSDVTEFRPSRTYQVWHDRAVFHFLTTPSQIESYRHLVNSFASQYLVMATFSESGPLKCSGLEIKQYSAVQLASVFEGNFKKVECHQEDHRTPFDTIQNFTYCSFHRLS